MTNPAVHEDKCCTACSGPRSRRHRKKRRSRGREGSAGGDDGHDGDTVSAGEDEKVLERMVVIVT